MNSIRCSLTNSLLFRRLKLDKALYSGARTLFTGEYLGLDVFSNIRENKNRAFGNMKENFFTRMRQQVNSTSTSMIFTEDLKSMLYLVDDNAEELDLIKQMIKRFHRQNKELRFGTFIFGPIVMRLFSHLQKPELALEMMRDEEMKGFFDQVRSFLIAMDLLYENGRYQDVVDLTDMCNESLELKYPRDIVVLTMAACYKMNTPESYKYALNCVTSARESGSSVIRRALHFAIALSLKQEKPDAAMELLSCLNLSNYVTNNNLKLITYAKLDRIQDAFPVLKSRLGEDVPRQTMVRGSICQEALEHLKVAVDKQDDTETSATFSQIVKSLNEAGVVTQQSIDDLLSTPITPRPKEEEDRFREPMRPFTGQRNDPFARRRVNMPPVRQRAFGGIMAE